ncbi:MAG: hypothetical protein ACO1QR_14100 [Chthoniobacteraceae bacterium]
MAEEVLVAQPLGLEMEAAGENLIAAMDGIGLNTSAVFWNLTDTGTWKLVVSSPEVTTHGALRIYRQLQRAISTIPKGSSRPQLMQISLTSPRDRIVKAVRGIIRTQDEVSRIRLEELTVDDVGIRSMLVYRSR